MKTTFAGVVLCLLTLNSTEALPTTIIYTEGEADSPDGLNCESLGVTRSDVDSAIAAARQLLYRYGFYIDHNGCHVCRTPDPWMETSRVEVRQPRPLHIHIQGNLLQVCKWIMHWRLCCITFWQHKYNLIWYIKNWDHNTPIKLALLMYFTKSDILLTANIANWAIIAFC